MDTVFGMLGSEDAKNLLSNLKTLLDIAKLLVPVIIAVVIGFIKLSNSYKIPKALYFTHSYSGRNKLKNEKASEVYGIVAALTIGAVALLLFLEFNVMEYDYFVLLSVIVVALSGVFMVISVIRWGWFSLKNTCHHNLGNTKKIKSSDKKMFVWFIVVFFSVVYFSIDTWTHNSLADPQTAVLNPAEIGGLALGGVLLYAVFVILVYSSMLKTDDKTEYISTGYVTETVGSKAKETTNYLFIHYFEEGFYVCSDRAYFDEQRELYIRNKEWMNGRTITPVDQDIYDQIIDLHNFCKYVEKAHKSEMNDEIKSLIIKGQREKLDGKEMDTLQEVQEKCIKADRDSRKSKRQKPQKKDKKIVNKQGKQKGKSA